MMNRRAVPVFLGAGCDADERAVAAMPTRRTESQSCRIDALAGAGRPILLVVCIAEGPGLHSCVIDGTVRLADGRSEDW